MVSYLMHFQNITLKNGRTKDYSQPQVDTLLLIASHNKKRVLLLHPMSSRNWLFSLNVETSSPLFNFFHCGQQLIKIWTSNCSSTLTVRWSLRRSVHLSSLANTMKQPMLILNTLWHLWGCPINDINHELHLRWDTGNDTIKHALL